MVKVSFFQGKPQITHPEMEIYSREKMEGKSTLEPALPQYRKTKKPGNGWPPVGVFTETLIKLLQENNIPEILPESILQPLQMMPRLQGFCKYAFSARP